MVGTQTQTQSNKTATTPVQTVPQKKDFLEDSLKDNLKDNLATQENDTETDDEDDLNELNDGTTDSEDTTDDDDSDDDEGATNKDGKLENNEQDDSDDDKDDDGKSEDDKTDKNAKDDDGKGDDDKGDENGEGGTSKGGGTVDTGKTNAGGGTGKTGDTKTSTDGTGTSGGTGGGKKLGLSGGNNTSGGGNASGGTATSSQGGGAKLKGSIGDWMDAHPDPKAEADMAKGESSLGQVERDERGLNAEVDNPPEKGWLDAVNPITAWGDFKKKQAANPWQGQDSLLSGLAQAKNIIELISDVAGKISLAATIGGAILTLLFFPVGAFLLTVGRVMNAVSLVMAGLKGVLGIVTSVITAIKAAREKDPKKRLAMMRSMKESMADIAGAGIEIIMSKIGGGGAKVGGGVAKGGLKGGLGELKNIGKNFKTGLKEMVTHPGKFAKDTLKKTFKVDDIKKLTNLKQFTAQVKDFKNLKAAGGGGFKGYLHATKTLNFPNLSKAAGGGAKDKFKATFKDLTDTKAGGFATNMELGTKGSDREVTKAHNEGKTAWSTSQNKMVNPNRGRKPTKNPRIMEGTPGTFSGSVLSSEAGKIDQMTKALHMGPRGRKSKLNALDLTDKQGNPLPKAKAFDNHDLNEQLEEKIKEGNKSANLFKPEHPVKMIRDLSVAAVDPEANFLKTAAGHLGAGGETAEKFMDGETTKEVWGTKGMKKEMLKPNKGPAADGLEVDIPKETINGLTTALVAKEIARALPSIDALMAKQSANSAAPVATQTVQAASAKAPTPADVVAADFSNRVSTAREKIKSVRERIGHDRKSSEEMLTEAQAAKKKLAVSKKDVAQGKKIAADKITEASSETKEIKESGKTLNKSGKDFAGAKQQGEGEQKKVDDKSTEGSKVEVKPDPNAQKKEEAKKAEEDKKKGFFGKLWDGVKKYSGLDLLAKAAKWVWKKMIAPAIKMAKEAMAKVMNYITEKMMSFVLKIVGSFMDQESQANLEAGFADLQAEDSAKSGDAAGETKEEAEKQEKNVSKAEKQVDDKIKLAETHIATADQVESDLDSAEAEIDTAEAKGQASRATFQARFGKFFEDADKPDEQVAKDNSKAEETGATLPAVASEALQSGADAVIERSDESKEAVRETSELWKDKVEHKADKDLEDAQYTAVVKAADQLDKNITSTHDTNETQRQGRMKGVKGEAKGLQTMSLEEGVKLFQKLEAQLATDAADVDTDQQNAVDSAREGYIKIAEGKG